MTNLIQLVKSTTSVLVMCLLASVIEIAQCGMKGDKGGGGGSDIILYKNNLVIRGGGGGKGGQGGGNLVIAGGQHGHGGHHGHHEEFHGGHHGFEHYGPPKHSKEENFILAMIRDGQDDKGKGGKGGKGKGGNNMGGGGKGGKGKGGGGNSNIVMGNMGNMKEKGSGEMNWEELILGGVRYVRVRDSWWE